MEPEFVNGLRKTDAETMEIAEMVLGKVGKSLVSMVEKLGVQAEYYATIESGQHPIHPAHSLFGCAVVLLERAGEPVRVGIDVDIEFPRAMLDKVPSQYPDLGVLVQQEYGAVDKDPYPYLTHGKLTRQRALETAVYNVAVQL